MKFNEFKEDIGDIAAQGIGNIAGAIADLPGVLKDAYKEAKAKIMQGVNRRKFYDWYNTNWKGTDQYVPRRAENFADAIEAFAKQEKVSPDTLKKITNKYNAEAMVSVSNDGKMLTKNNVVDQLFLDMAELEGKRAVTRTAKAKGIKNFGRLSGKKKATAEPDDTEEPTAEPEKEKTPDFKVGDGKPGNPLSIRA
tara:strand:- start:572 stop:1156 length:585 start_codon:yes stop_codon:yes gene_type:complete